MLKNEGTQTVLSYATPPAEQTRQSRYGIASLIVSALTVLWFITNFFEMPFDPYKHHRIGTVASVLAVILAIAAYRQPNRRRSLAHVAMGVAAFVFLAHVLLVPL